MDSKNYHMEEFLTKMDSIGFDVARMGHVTNEKLNEFLDEKREGISEILILLKRWKNYLLFYWWEYF